jgi:HD-like signal output (HDOD) protein
MADPLISSPESLLARLKPGETPIFRHTKLAILELRKRDESLSAKELARVILADPLATLRVIYQANNRNSRSLGGEIATVEHAIMMQGVGPFFSAAASLPVLEDSLGAQSGLAEASLYRLLRIAQHAAWQARDFTVLTADTRAEEVEVAALLYYVPDLLFWLQAPDIARKLARQRRKMAYADAEQQILGMSLAQLRLDLMGKWRVPDLIRDLLAPEHAERPRQSILEACLGIAHRSRHGWWHEALSDCYISLASVVGVPLELVVATVHINAMKVARYGRWIPSAPAAAWLPMLPGPWPPEPEEPEDAVADAAAPKPPPAAAPTTVSQRAEPQAEDRGAVCPMPNQKVLNEALRNIETHLDSSLTLNQMSAHILRGLHTGMGLTRLIFAMVTPDRKRIKTRFTLGIPVGDPLRHFEFSLGGKDLFAQLMLKPQGIWMKDDNRAKLWPMIDPKLQAMIGEADFFAMALFSGARPIGLIYADRGHDGCDLDNHTYTDFKMFCLQAARGLGKLKS